MSHADHLNVLEMMASLATEYFIDSVSGGQRMAGGDWALQWRRRLAKAALLRVAPV